METGVLIDTVVGEAHADLTSQNTQSTKQLKFEPTNRPPESRKGHSYCMPD